MLACTYRPLNTSRLLFAQGQFAECSSQEQTRLKQNVQGQPTPESHQFPIRMEFAFEENAQGGSHGQTRLLKEKAQGQPKPESHQFPISK